MANNQNTQQYTKNQCSSVIQTHSVASNPDISVSSRVEVEDGRNLETFTLIWLDLNEKKVMNDIHLIQKTLRQTVNRIITFNDTLKLEDWLEQKKNSEKIILVISGGLEKEWQPIIERIDKMSRLMSVYVFCNMNTVGLKEKLTNKNEKVSKKVKI